MVKVDYSQKKTQKIVFVVPTIFFIVWFVMFILEYQENDLTRDFLTGTMIPALLLLIFVIISFIIAVKQSNKKRDEITRILSKGCQVDGEIVEMNTHTYATSKDNYRYQHYYYTFTVRYLDPSSDKEVIRESVRTYQYYPLRSNYCILSVLDDDVLVEKVDARAIESKWSLKDVVLTAVVLIALVEGLAVIVIPILGTL